MNLRSNYFSSMHGLIAYIPFVVSTAVGMGMIIFSLFLPQMNTSFFSETCFPLTEGWSFQSEDGTVQTVSLPGLPSTNIENGIRITNTLPADSPVPYNSFGIRSAFHLIKVYIDGELYASTEDPYIAIRHLDKTSGCFIWIQRLPQDVGGKEITLEITSPYRDYEITASSLYLGSRSSLLMYFAKKYMWRALVGFAYLVIGITLFLHCISMLSRKYHADIKSMLCISSFIIWIGLWIIAESRATQFFVDANTTVLLLAFVSVRLAVISFVLYYRKTLFPRWREWNAILFLLLCLEMVVSTTLQFVGIADYYELIKPYVVLFTATLVSMLIQMFLEWRSYHNEKLRYMFVGTFFLGVLVAVDTLSLFFSKIGISFGVLSIVGVSIMMLCIIHHEYVLLNSRTILATQAGYYKQLASVDPMTKCNNRLVMQTWISTHGDGTPEQKSRISVTMCDLNSLKKINDSFGHDYGDEAICNTADLLKEFFKGEDTVICRSGGDEFTILSSTLTPEDLQRIEESVFQRSQTIDQSSKYPFSISIGYCFFDPAKDKYLESTLVRADEKMYEMKRNYYAHLSASRK